MPLLSYADLAAPAKSDPSKSTAEVCLQRMKSSTSPMPPSPAAPASAAEIAALETWIAAGLPEGTCQPEMPEGEPGAPDAGPSPFDGPTVCTSGSYWDDGKDGSSRMFPGRACINCHENEDDDDAPNLIIGGTVYPTGHEPNDCNGFESSDDDEARVIVVDAKNTVFDLAVNSAGNFLKKGKSSAITFPIKAKVTYGGKERVMMGAQSSGDCNSCHTENGKNGAPGRIVLP